MNSREHGAGRASRRWVHIGVLVVVICTLAYPSLDARSARDDREHGVRTIVAGDPTRPSSVEIPHGEDDDAIIAAMPPLDLATIMAAESEHDLPRLDFADAIGPGTAPAADVADLNTISGDSPMPDTVLLWSGDWFGAKLWDAANDLGVDITDDQLRVLESIAVARGVNTRLLLTLARVKDAPARYRTPETWLKWLYLEASRVRDTLKPYQPTDQPSIRFSDGRVMAMMPALRDAPAWALATSLGAGATLTETAGRVADWSQRYARVFGPPTRTEAVAPAASPFLYKPYRVTLTGRGYYDHTYPSVDNGGTPNIAGMRNYLNQSNVNYDTHDGDDLWMPYGSPVYAPVSGPVLWTDGQAVLIGYQSNSYHIYIGHLSRRDVNTGATVAQGQQIGLSGRANVDHIHFEVRHNGKQTDTMGWYGGGSDPCPGGPAPSARYLGCEPSTWLWVDMPPPNGSDTTPPTGTITSPSDGSQTSNPSFMLSANASDNGSGVNRVEFHARYDNDWHQLCSDTSAPYSCTWNADAIGDQTIVFTIHVIDNAGNRAMDPGGYRSVRLARVLTPPRNLHVTGTSNSTVSLRWDDASGEDAYYVYAGVWDGSNWFFVRVASLRANTTAYTDGPLSCDASYAYQVTTVKGGNESARGDSAVARTSVCPLGPVPRVLLPLVRK